LSSAASYTFKHALVRDAAHDSLLRSKRRAVHQRISETLEQETIQGATAAAKLPYL
jgi:predicted ATPase